MIGNRLANVVTERIMNNLIRRTDLHCERWDPRYSEIRASVLFVLESAAGEIEEALVKE